MENVYYSTILEAEVVGMKRIVFPPMGDSTYGNSIQLTSNCFAAAIQKLNNEKN